jgi:Lon protease-like protein
VLTVPKRPVPVFPLPGFVLFPHVMVPLHVFELRYRTMVRDALSAERLLVLTLLKPGWEGEYLGSPEFHSPGCLARIDEVEWLPNDCYNLKLLGLTRARLGPVTREFPYRAAQVEVLPQEPYSEDDTLVQMARRPLLDLYRSLAPAGGGDTPPGEELPYEALVNAVSVGLPVDPREKHALLCLDSVIDRGRRLCELAARRPPPEARGRPGAGDRN